MTKLRTSLYLSLFALVCVVVGCASKTSKLVGVWKARPIKPITSSNLRDVQDSVLMSRIADGLTLEFNNEGKFKLSQATGSGTGNYKWEGDTLLLTFDTFAPQQPLHFKFGEDGKSLENVSEFNSDVRLILDKQG